MRDYQRGEFGIPWEHTASDAEWAAQCDQRAAMRTARQQFYVRGQQGAGGGGADAFPPE